MTMNEDFAGKIGRTFRDSEPWWPELPTAPQDRPNVLIILFDDLGFAHLNCYGSTIATPNINRLAANGLRFTNFHVTPLCSPTRASLLTGRNHHAVGMRSVTQFDPGYPNMRGQIPRSAATMAEILSDENYATFAIGKWHLCPVDAMGQAGPFDNWPLQRGFDRFYGFLSGETDQFYPELCYDNHLIEPPARPEDGYHLTEDLVDHATGFLRDHQSVYPGQPFFLYFALGATHAPHQAPQEFIERYRGKFDVGWDAIREEWFARQQEMGIVPEGTQLAPRNRGVEAWDDMPENARNFAVALQEAFAGFLEHTDEQLGRLFNYLESSGQLDNTIVMLLADNGASQEGGPQGVSDEPRLFGPREDLDELQSRLHDIGGPRSDSNYPWGWAQAGNTPLRWYKQNTHGGGVRVPLIVHWPERIDEAGTIRTQFHHVTDVLPTVLETLGVEPPSSVRGSTQLPIAGTSFSYALSDAEADTAKEAQYFEMFGHRGIWVDGWKAVTWHRRGTEWSDDEWELYHVDEDFSETNNLAEEEPEKLRELIDRWWIEAGKHGVLPLDDRTIEINQPSQLPGAPHAGLHYRYTPPITHMPVETSPAIDLGSWTLEASISRTSTEQQGVIFNRGSILTGVTCYIKDNRLHFDYHAYESWSRIKSDAPLPAGDFVLGVSLQSESHQGPGEVTLTIDGETVATGKVAVLQRRILFAHGEFDIGADRRSPVGDSYDPPFEFEGQIHSVDIEVTPYEGEAAFHAQAERQRQIMARQ
ncbi:MAG: arylsulfatase [Chloroflexi bacterium]|nr:arylsulfatase [Chloroflexota bacterium]